MLISAAGDLSGAGINTRCWWSRPALVIVVNAWCRYQRPVLVIVVNTWCRYQWSVPGAGDRGQCPGGYLVPVIVAVLMIQSSQQVKSVIQNLVLVLVVNAGC